VGLHRAGPDCQRRRLRSSLVPRQRTRSCGGSPVVLLVRQGQNRLFTSHLLFDDCGEDGSGAAWRTALRRRVPSSPVMEGPLRGHGDRAESAPSSHPLPHFFSPFLPLPCHSPIPSNPSRHRCSFSSHISPSSPAYGRSMGLVSPAPWKDKSSTSPCLPFVTGP
jgi:hypothetical protein